MRWYPSGTHGSEENWRARAAEADFGVVMADYAAAYTGSITVLSSKDKGRSVSLLPTVLMAIIPVDRLKTRLGEIMVNFDQAVRAICQRAFILSLGRAVLRILRMI